MLTMLYDVSKATVATTVLMMATWLSTTPFALQFGGAMGEPATPEGWLAVAARQGAASVLLGAVLFFYRRDYQNLTDYWKEQNNLWKNQNQLVVELVRASAISQAETAAAQREFTIVVHGLKRAVEQQGLEVYRADDPAGEPQQRRRRHADRTVGGT